MKHKALEISNEVGISNYKVSPSLEMSFKRGRERVTIVKCRFCRSTKRRSWTSATHNTWFTVESTNDYLRLSSYFIPEAAGARVESADAERTLSPLIAKKRTSSGETVSL